MTFLYWLDMISYTTLDKSSATQQNTHTTKVRINMLENLKSKSPLKNDFKTVVFSFIGGFVAIFILAFATNISEILFIIAPFGASCVLLFAAWEAPLAQPRNLIGGHLIASIIGLLVLQFLGNQPWTLALGVGLAISIMVLTKTTHPPAGADPILIIVAGSGWNFLLFPVLTGSVTLLILAILLNRLVFRRDYPKFWF